VGAHLPRIYRAGQRERPGELSVLPLDATKILLFLFLLDLALAMDGEGRVLDADINVFFVDARNFKLQSNVERNQESLWRSNNIDWRPVNPA
jgi:hypothetical protein